MNRAAALGLTRELMLELIKSGHYNEKSVTDLARDYGQLAEGLQKVADAAEHSGPKY